MNFIPFRGQIKRNWSPLNLWDNFRMITKMRFVSITVTDLDAAHDFYINRLGFQVRVEMPLPGGNQFVMLAPAQGGAALVYSLPLPGREHAPLAGIAFETEDIQAAFEDLTSKGVVFSRPPIKTPWGGMEAAFSDPFGNSYLLQQGGL